MAHNERSLPPPQAQRRPVRITKHGDVREDGTAVPGLFAATQAGKAVVYP